MPDLMQLIGAHPALTTLARLVYATGLEPMLRSQAQLTLFAPADPAFTSLAPAWLAQLQQDRLELETLLFEHLAAGVFVAADLMLLPDVVMLSGQRLTTDSSLGLQLGGAYLVEADLLADNGVLHCIDRLLGAKGS